MSEVAQLCTLAEVVGATAILRSKEATMLTPTTMAELRAPGDQKLKDKEMRQTGGVFVSFNHNYFMHTSLLTAVFIFLRESGFGRGTSTPWERLLSLL